MIGSRRILLVYLLLFGLAVPWYWQFLPIAVDTLILGMPVWAFGAIASSLLLSLFSAWVLARQWPCESEGDGQADSARSAR